MSNKPKRNNHNHDVNKVYNNVQYNFLKNKHHFASIINYALHLSISPDDLLDLDSGECVLFADEKKVKDEVEKSLINLSKELFRDLIKQVNMKYDGKCIYVCIENQRENEKNIMGRINLYNALTYNRAEIFVNNHRIPVITILIGCGEYTFAIKHCFDDYDKELVKMYKLKQYLPHYKVPVINIKDISEEDMAIFSEEMKAMIMIIKLSTRKLTREKEKEYFEEIKKMMQNDSIGIETKDLGAVYLSMGRQKKYIKDGFYDFYQREKAESKAEGKSEERANSLRNLMQSMNWSFDTAANALCIPQNERAIIRDLVC